MRVELDQRVVHGAHWVDHHEGGLLVHVQAREIAGSGHLQDSPILRLFCGEGPYGALHRPMHNRTVRRQTLILQARIAVPPFLARENSPFPRDESLVEGVTARAKRAESGSFRGARSRAGTRKKGLDKGEQTPEE